MADNMEFEKKQIWKMLLGPKKRKESQWSFFTT